MFQLGFQYLLAKHVAVFDDPNKVYKGPAWNEGEYTLHLGHAPKSNTLRAKAETSPFTTQIMVKSQFCWSNCLQLHWLCRQSEMSMEQSYFSLQSYQILDALPVRCWFPSCCRLPEVKQLEVNWFYWDCSCYHLTADGLPFRAGSNG